MLEVANRWKVTSNAPLEDHSRPAPATGMPTIAKPDQSLTRKEARQAFVTPHLETLEITPSGWAKKAGLHPSIIYDYLNGKTKTLRPKTSGDLAEALGVSINDLPK